MKAVLTGLTGALMLLVSGPTFGEGIAKRQQPRIGTPYTEPAPPFKAHNFYVGGLLGYVWGLEEEGEKPRISGENYSHGGAFAGYLYRPTDRLGIGGEIDYVGKDFNFNDGTASVRGRAGMFVAPGTFVYGTAGIARSYQDAAPAGLRRGAVVGGGVEVDVLKNVVARAEVLHYRNSDEDFSWGEEGSSVARLGVGFKF